MRESQSGGGAGTRRSDVGVAGKAKATINAIGEATDQVRERASDALDTARAKVGNAQATVADKLEAGAEAIRERVGEDGPTASRRTRARRIARAGDAVAERLDDTALWFREHEVIDFPEMLRRQLKDHPGRTALIALGLGILIGRRSRD